MAVGYVSEINIVSAFSHYNYLFVQKTVRLGKYECCMVLKGVASILFSPFSVMGGISTDKNATEP